MSDPIVEIAFVGGIDESIREEVMDAGASFTVLQNGRYDQKGGYAKRLGYVSRGAARVDGSNRSEGTRLLTNGDQLCVIADGSLDVYSSALGMSVKRSRVPECTVRPLEVPSVALFPSQEVLGMPSGDTCTVAGGGGNYTAVAWRSNPAATFAMAALLDAETGAVVSGPTSLTFSDSLTIALASYGTIIVAVVFDAEGDRVKLFYLDTQDVSHIASGWIPQGIIASDYLHSGVAVAWSDRVAIAYVNTSGGTSQVSVHTLLKTGITGSLSINTSSVTPREHSLDLSEGGTVLWAAWGENAAVKACGITGTTSLTATTTTGTVMTMPGSSIAKIRVGARDSGKAAVYVNYSITHVRSVAVKTSVGAAATDGQEALYGGSTIQSRPVLRNGRLYAHFSGVGFTELILCDCTPDTSGSSDLTFWLRPVGVPVDRNVWSGACSVRTALLAGTGRYVFAFNVYKSGSIVGVALVEYDFESPQRQHFCPVNGSTFLGGGVLSVFDGTRVNEANFLLVPQTPTLDTSSGDLTFVEGGRRYVATFEAIDADGNWHVSGVSSPSELTGNLSSEQVTITSSPLSITMRGYVADAIQSPGDAVTSLRAHLWATTDGGEPPYYSLGEIPLNPNATTWTFTDDIDDGALSEGALLYGTGNLPGTGEASSQDHRAPRGLTHIISYAGMLVGAHGSVLHFSSQPIDGQGTWFSPAFTRLVDEEVTGLAVQDGSLIAFTRRGVYALTGDVPSDNGLLGGLSSPRRLAVQWGCIDANSIVTTDVGTFYQSDRGIELLTRGQSNEHIGDRVRRTVAAFPVITSAVLDTRAGLVRFSLAEARAAGLASGGGRDLIFDLILGVWCSVDRKAGSGADQATQDACMAVIEGEWRYCWLATDGVLYSERAEDDASASLDAGDDWVILKAATSWMHAAGIHGEQFVDQVLLLSERNTAHAVTMTTDLDYDRSTESKAWTYAQVGGLNARDWLINGMTQTTSNAIRVTLEDAAPVGDPGTGAGPTWLCLSFAGQAHRGPKRSTSAQRGGS